MLQHGFTQADIDRIQEQTTQDIANAVEYGKSSPYPSLDTIYTDVYA